MLLIQNADVYSPKHMGKVDVLVCNDKVVLVREHIDCPFEGVDVIDASGKKLVPGFIDQHVHITGGGGEGGLHTRVPELQLSAAIKAGVTTLVGLLGTDGFTRSIENLVAKTKALNNEGITAYCLTSAYQYPPVTLTGSVAKDIIYISEVIGCKLALSDHRGSHPTKEEMIRLLSDIRMASLIAGKPGELHVHIGSTGNGIEPLIDIVKTTDIPIRHIRPTHMGRHPEQAAAFNKLGGYADFTAKTALAKTLKEYWDELDHSLITVSSDSNGSMPKWDAKKEHIVGMGVGSADNLLLVLRGLVEQGIALEEALPLFTSNVATALELYPHKGCIADGSDADLLLLDNDLAIDSVIAKGRIMMQSKELLVRGTFE